MKEDGRANKAAVKGEILMDSYRIIVAQIYPHVQMTNQCFCLCRNTFITHIHLSNNQ